MGGATIVNQPVIAATPVPVAPAPMLRVKQYKNMRDFERDAQRMLGDGWRLEGQSHQPGNLGLGTAIAADLLAGPVGVLAASGMTRKGKITITWMKDNPTPLDFEIQQARLSGKKTLDRQGERRTPQAWGLLLLALISLVLAIMTMVSIIGGIVFAAVSGYCFMCAHRAWRGLETVKLD